MMAIVLQQEVEGVANIVRVLAEDNEQLTAENARLREQLRILIEGGAAADELITMFRALAVGLSATPGLSAWFRADAMGIVARIDAYHEKYTMSKANEYVFDDGMTDGMAELSLSLARDCINGLAAENARLRAQVAEAVGLINHFFKIETPNEYTIWYEDMSKFSAMMEAKDDTD